MECNQRQSLFTKKTEMKGDSLPAVEIPTTNAEISENQEKWKGKPCKHLAKGIDIEKLTAQIARVSLLQCQGCGQATKNSRNSKDKKGKSSKQSKKKGVSASDSCNDDGWPRTWVCLACGLVGCGSISFSSPSSDEGGGGVKESIGTGHAWKHWLYVFHPYVLQCGHKLSCWCFPCRSYLEFRFIKRSPDAEQDKKGLVMVGPSASPLMLQALKIVQEKLIKESAKFEQIRLIDAVVEKRPDKEEVKEAAVVEAQEGAVSSRCMVKGLLNLGNTCFFNAVLQNLLAINVLNDHFGKPAQVTEGHLTACLRKLYLEMATEGQAAKDVGQSDTSAHFKRSGKGRALHKSSDGVIDPRTLFTAICDKVPRFRGYRQQDSHELLRFLLDCLHIEELNARKAESRSSEISSGKGDDSMQKHIDMDANQKNNSCEFVTLVESVFCSELSSTICCCECGHSSVVFESYLDLSLPIPSKRERQKNPFSQVYSNRDFSSGLGKGSIKTDSYNDDKSRKEGKGKINCSWDSSINKSEVNTEVPLCTENMSSSFLVGNMGCGEDASTTNTSDLAEDLGLKGYLDIAAGSGNFVLGGTLDESEIMGTPDHNGISRFVSERASTMRVSDFKSAFQNKGLLNQGTAFSPLEMPGILKKHVPSAEKDLGAYNSQGMLPMPNLKARNELRQQNEPLRIIGDSDVLPHPDEDLNVAEECIQTTERYQKLCVGSIVETSGKLSTTESEIDPKVIDGEFDEEKTSLVRNTGTEAGESEGFQLNEKHGGDGTLATGLAIATQEDNETKKAEPEDILPMSIDGCLAAFTRPEILWGENAWQCENCFSRSSKSSFKLEAKPEQDRKIQYKQSFISARYGRGTYKEQVHLAAGRGNIEGVMDSNFSNLPEKQLINSGDPTTVRYDKVLASLRYDGILDFGGDIYEQLHSAYFNKRLMSNLNSDTQELAQKEGKMLQYVDRFNDLNVSHTDNQRSYIFPSRDIGVINSCDNNSNNFSGQGEFTVKTGRIFDAKDQLATKAETRPKNDKAVPHIDPAICSNMLKGKQTCGVSGRDVFDFKDSVLKVDELQNEALRSSWGKARLQGSNSKEKNHGMKGLKRSATKILLISKAPHILTIHLKRFTHGLVKLNGHVTFQERLDLRPFLDPRCPDKESCIYRLTGVVEHSGTMRSGHYVAYIRGREAKDCQKAENDGHCVESTWYRISDTFVRKLSLSEVLQSEAYLLFYEKITC